MEQTGRGSRLRAAGPRRAAGSAWPEPGRLPRYPAGAGLQVGHDQMIVLLAPADRQSGRIRRSPAPPDRRRPQQRAEDLLGGRRRPGPAASAARALYAAARTPRPPPRRSPRRTPPPRPAPTARSYLVNPTSPESTRAARTPTAAPTQPAARPRTRRVSQKNAVGHPAARPGHHPVTATSACTITRHRRRLRQHPKHHRHRHVVRQIGDQHGRGPAPAASPPRSGPRPPSRRERPRPERPAATVSGSSAASTGSTSTAITSAATASSGSVSDPNPVPHLKHDVPGADPGQRRDLGNGPGVHRAAATAGPRAVRPAPGSP